MVSVELGHRLDALIDDLILDGGVEATSLASILLVAKDALKSDHVLSLSRKVWAANSELVAARVGDDEGSGPNRLITLDATYTPRPSWPDSLQAEISPPE